MAQEPLFIVGTGAQATALADAIGRCGLPYRFLDRRGPVALTREFSDFEGNRRQIEAPSASPDEMATASLVLFAVKAYQLSEAARDHAKLFSPLVPFISLVNGAIETVLGELSKLEPSRPWRLGISTVAVSENREGLLQVFSGPSGFFGWGPLYPPSSSPSEIESILFGSSSFRWLSEPQVAARKKWLFNTTLNTIVAAKSLPRNGDVLDNLSCLHSVFNEAYRLGETVWGHWREEPGPLYDQLLTLIEQTRANENSMMRDRRLGKKTEIAYLAGLAQTHQGFPLLQQLCKVVN